MKDSAEIKAQLAEMNALIARSEKGKPAPGDLAIIKKYFEEMPDFWQYGGDMAKQALIRLYKEAAPNNLLVSESIKKGLEVLRKDLGHDNAPKLEKMLIEEICYCWLAHSIIQNRYAGIVLDSITLAQGDFWERRINQSQKRYLRALDTLARVRKLLPPIQINIGGQQVNQVVGKD